MVSMCHHLFPEDNEIGWHAIKQDKLGLINQKHAPDFNEEYAALSSLEPSINSTNSWSILIC